VEERNEGTFLIMVNRKALKIKKCSMLLATVVAVLICLGQVVLAATYQYDNLHRLTSVVYDNGMQITYNYDEVGNRTQRVSTLLADTSIDGKVDFKDFAIIASRWLDADCIGPGWCEGADIDWSSTVDIEDLAILAQQWLERIQ
jgi:YD repeat-containing protein